MDTNNLEDLLGLVPAKVPVRGTLDSNRRQEELVDVDDVVDQFRVDEFLERANQSGEDDDGSHADSAAFVSGVHEESRDDDSADGSANNDDVSGNSRSGSGTGSAGGSGNGDSHGSGDEGTETGSGTDTTDDDEGLL